MGTEAYLILEVVLVMKLHAIAAAEGAKGNSGFHKSMQIVAIAGLVANLLFADLLAQIISKGVARSAAGQLIVLTHGLLIIWSIANLLVAGYLVSKARKLRGASVGGESEASIASGASAT